MARLQDAKFVAALNKGCALDVLLNIRSALEKANTSGVIVDTIWQSECCTLFDYIDLEIRAVWDSLQSESTPEQTEGVQLSLPIDV